MPKRKVQTIKRVTRNSSIQEESKSNPNQKKDPPKHRKPFYINSYMEEIIKEIDEGKEEAYSCEICPGKPKLVRRSVYRHIIESSTHEIFATNRIKEHEQLKTLLAERGQNKGQKERSSEEVLGTESYLQF